MQEIGLRKQDEIARAKHHRVFCGLVVALGDGEQRDVRVLSEVEARRTHEIADVLDEQDVDGCKIDRMQRVVNHMRVEVAGLAGGDLHRRHALRPDAPRIVFGLKIAFDHGDAILLANCFDRGLQQAGLSRARRGHQIDREHAAPLQMLAIVGGRVIVLIENACEDLDRGMVDRLCRNDPALIAHVNGAGRRRASAIFAHGVLPRPSRHQPLAAAAVSSVQFSSTRFSKSSSPDRRSTFQVPH